MALAIAVDPGVEKWIPVARRMLSRAKEASTVAAGPVHRRAYIPEAGVTIEVWSISPTTLDLDKIVIRGGGTGDFIVFPFMRRDSDDRIVAVPLISVPPSNADLDILTLGVNDKARIKLLNAPATDINFGYVTPWYFRKKVKSKWVIDEAAVRTSSSPAFGFLTGSLFTPVFDQSGTTVFAWKHLSSVDPNPVVELQQVNASRLIESEGVALPGPLLPLDSTYKITDSFTRSREKHTGVDFSRDGRHLILGDNGVFNPAFAASIPRFLGGGLVPFLGRSYLVDIDLSTGLQIFNLTPSPEEYGQRDFNSTRIVTWPFATHFVNETPATDDTVSDDLSNAVFPVCYGFSSDNQIVSIKRRERIATRRERHYADTYISSPFIFRTNRVRNELDDIEQLIEISLPGGASKSFVSTLIHVSNASFNSPLGGPNTANGTNTLSKETNLIEILYADASIPAVLYWHLHSVGSGSDESTAGIDHTPSGFSGTTTIRLGLLTSGGDRTIFQSAAASGVFDMLGFEASLRHDSGSTVVTGDPFGGAPGTPATGGTVVTDDHDTVITNPYLRPPRWGYKAVFAGAPGDKIALNVVPMIFAPSVIPANGGGIDVRTFFPNMPKSIFFPKTIEKALVTRLVEFVTPLAIIDPTLNPFLSALAGDYSGYTIALYDPRRAWHPVTWDDAGPPFFRAFMSKV